MTELLFGRFFRGLRAAGLRVGLSEWMSLMRALSQGAVEPDLSDFYVVARALLVKSEAHFDTFDQVFTAVFGNGKLPTKAVEELLAWLEIARKMDELSPEARAALEALSLEELRRLFEERLAEQKERHDGGSYWIGTGGTSPFGHGGANPAGVRVGGAGGGRSAIQIASARRFREYRSDRALDTRGMAVALKKLRRLSRKEGLPELDVEASIDKTCRNAGELTLEMVPPRENEARVLLLMDVGGSMDPYAHMVEQLFSAAASLDHWRRFEAFTFHNCPYARLVPAARRAGDAEVETADVIADRPAETFLIVVGDAYMAPSELMEAFGAVDAWLQNRTPGIVWLHRLRRHFTRAVWLNPIPQRGWYGWTIQAVARLFPMVPLTLEGLDEAMDILLKRAPEPTPDLAALFPDL